VRLRLHALAYNLANLLRTRALPERVGQWSLATLRNRLVKTDARIVRHGRSVILQMAEVMVGRGLFQQILAAIAALRPLPSTPCWRPALAPPCPATRREACARVQGHRSQTGPLT
jgi:hypothetical protein